LKGIRVNVRTAAVVVAMAIVVASTATAQPEIGAAEPIDAPLATHSVFGATKTPALLWASSVAADWITTYRFSSQYGDLLHETNPLLRGLDRHPVWLVTAGTAIDATTAWAAYRFIGPNHPRLLRLMLYGATAYRSYLAAYNITMMRDAEAIRLAPPPTVTRR
jgi:hypothetical protein